jgi:hypothetical protein
MWGKKKAKPLINNYLALSFVTSEVEKSNFYRDLERLNEWEFKNVKKE